MKNTSEAKTVDNKIVNIALNNYCAGCGKDTVADILVNDYGYIKVGLSEGIYHVAHEIYGVPKDTKPPRSLLQHIGESLRLYNPSLWVDLAISKTKEYNEQGYSVVISDVRKEMEHVLLKKQGFENVMVTASDETIEERLLSRDGYIAKSVSELKKDTLENQLIPFRKTMTEISNDGTMFELQCEIKSLMKRLGKQPISEPCTPCEI